MWHVFLFLLQVAESRVDSSRVEELLNEWKVDQYRQNVHLYNIPESRIQQERDRIVNELRQQGQFVQDQQSPVYQCQLVPIYNTTSMTKT